MSKILQVCTAQTRNACSQTISILTAVLCSVMLLLGWSGASAQHSASPRSAKISKKNESSVKVSRFADRFDDWRAQYGSTPELEAFIERLSRPLETAARTDSRRVAKGATTSSVFEDMQQLPDQSLNDSEGWGSPVFVNITDDVIGLAYADRGVSGPDFFGPPDVGPRLLFRKTTDGGLTWSDPVVVGYDADFILDYLWLSIAINDAGRLVIVDETPFEDNHAFYSDDFGDTWTEIAYEETNAADHILGPVNGSFWVQEIEYPQVSLEYIASTDGITWDAPKTMLPVAVNREVYITDIARTGTESYVATLQQLVFQPCCTESIRVSRSTDNGASWSFPMDITPPALIYANDPQIDAVIDGPVYLAYSGLASEDDWGGDIFTSVSTDGGATFSQSEAFTRYVGDDFGPTQALVGGMPFVAFESPRSGSSLVWYGMPGTTPDLDPPPVVRFYDYPGSWAPANRAFPITPVLVLDESGAESASLLVTRGGDEATVPLFDDGAHNDFEAGDGIFGGTSAPIEYGPDQIVRPVGTDDGGNTTYGYEVRVSIAALHDIGDLVLAVSPEGGMGNEMLQEFPPVLTNRYPKEDGFSFIPYAGLWVGINKAPGKRVSHLFYDNFYGSGDVGPSRGDWQVTEYPTEGPGESELDVVMHYDDSGAPYPMGLDVKQTTYQWSDASFVIFDYEITNSSATDLSNLYVAMVLDPDMPSGGDFFDDQVGYDADRALIYALDSGNWCQENDPSYCTDTHIGVALLDDGEGLGKTAPVPHTAHRWNGFEEGDPERNQLGLDIAMFDRMTSGIWAGFNLGLKSVVGEWRMVLTAQPFDLAAGATRRLVFGMVAGAGEAGIKASTDVMIDRFEKAVLAIEQTSDVPAAFALEQNYPNPFNPSTTIPFSIESTSPVSLTVFDVLGRQVGRIVNETLSAGSYTATFGSETLPSGTYYYTLTADGKSITKSMFLLK